MEYIDLIEALTLEDNENHTVEVENILKCLLNNNNNNEVSDEDQNPGYDIYKAKLLSSWMCDSQRTPEEIYELIGPKFEKLQDGSENKLTQAFLAAVVLDALSVIHEREIVVLTGHWTKIARCMIKYFYENEKTDDVIGFMNPALHIKETRWILNACNQTICPDHTLRLELFGFIWHPKYCFWDKECLYELTCEQQVEFFVQTISGLDSDDIYYSHAHDICFSTYNLLCCFPRFRRYNPPFYNIKSLMYHEGFECSRELKLLQNILKLTVILAQIARFRFQLKSRPLRMWLNACLTLFLDLRKLFRIGMESFVQICLQPVMYPYFRDLVDNVTTGILDLSGKLNNWRKSTKSTKCRQDKFRRLETRRNYIVYCGRSKRPPLDLPPLLLKRELGMLKSNGRTKLQTNVLNLPNLLLSVNHSKNSVDFSKYDDQYYCDQYYDDSTSKKDANDDLSDDDNQFIRES